MYSVCKIPYWPFVPVGWLTWCSRWAGRRWPRSKVLMTACPKAKERKCIATTKKRVKIEVLYWEITVDGSQDSQLQRFCFRKTRYTFAVPCYFDTVKTTHVVVQLLNLLATAHKVFIHMLTPTHLSTQHTSHSGEGGLSQEDVYGGTLVEQMWGHWWRVCALHWMKAKLSALQSDFQSAPILLGKNLVRKVMCVFCYQESQNWFKLWLLKAVYRLKN